MLERRIWSFIYFIHVKGEETTPQLDMKIMKEIRKWKKNRQDNGQNKSIKRQTTIYKTYT
jgi:hypothetical protein